jgi:hypothetical protein
MPELDLMPPGRSMPAAIAPRLGLGDVLARATRRRRRQQFGALASGAAACAAVLALSLASGGTVDSLRVTPAHPVDGTGMTVAPLTRDSATKGMQQGLPSDATQTQRNDAAGSAAGSMQNGAVQRQEQAAAAAAIAQQARSGGEVGPPHTVTSYDASRGCGAVGTATAQGWCGYYDGALTGRGGQRVELAETLCRLPGQGPGTLKVDSGQQAEFVVFDKDNWRKWTWSTGHRFSKRGSTLQVATGTCLRWQVTWNVVDEAGRPLGPGTYTLDGRTRAYPAETTDHYAAADAQFVSFTVTS